MIRKTPPIRKRTSYESLLAGIAHWAAQLPDYEWTLWPPPDGQQGYLAVKTKTGRILTSTRAFQSRWLRHIDNDPKYGGVVAYVALEK